jgi:hypothetical protein
MRRVIGIAFRAFEPAAGHGPKLILLGDLAEEVGISPAFATANVRRLPRRLREAVTKASGASGAAVPCRWASDLAGYDLADLPSAFAPLWRAARHYALTGEAPAGEASADAQP